MGLLGALVVLFSYQDYKLDIFLNGSLLVVFQCMHWGHLKL